MAPLGADDLIARLQVSLKGNSSPPPLTCLSDYKRRSLETSIGINRADRNSHLRCMERTREELERDDPDHAYGRVWPLVGQVPVHTLAS